ncbi:NAD(P)/FAD-dependent oxidoreductase [Nocardia sp. NPDC051463]|uniref:flavin-containing monooxygenase n=1 Tax=Nocardia sp. NPDC051463 TaxID=3154845 RepID=UPI00343AD939
MDKQLDLKVVIVGGGFGGLGMGVALKKAGIDSFAIVEKGGDVGGVWRENTYPGCSCDVPSHLYSFSFAPYRSAKTRYPSQERILAYLRGVADTYDLLPHLRLHTTVVEASYREDIARWELTTGTGEHIVADLLVFAVGQLHRRYVPDIPGREDFTGAAFHSAHWDHRQNLRGRDVAVVGTGSSAGQLLPKIAADARTVTVYQRTPHWVLPKPAAEFGAISRWVLRMPGAHRLYRQALYYGADIALAPIVHRGWSARPAHWLARIHLRRHVSDPALRAALTPDYPIGSKRIVFDSRFHSTLGRENVELVTDPIARITRNGIETGDGTHRRADVIVWATGFRASEFLTPMTVRGRGGRLLREQWSDGAEAFLGLAVPGFPNAFLIAGPNSFNPAGSNPGMKERQIAYIMACLRWRDAIGAPAIEVSGDAMRQYRQWLERAIAKTVWPAAGASWYKHEKGRVTNPWPASARTFARMLHHHPAAAFVPVAANDAAPVTPLPIHRHPPTHDEATPTAS